MTETKQRKFKTEVRQVLDIVIHSLYTHKEVFLRELISNASDAIDRCRFEALSDKAILEDDSEWKIKIVPDKENRTLTISDNGIGMHEQEIDKSIGTIASSGTRHFLDELQKRGENAAPELIGQFGVGFYSGFMVADKVTLVTRRAGDPEDAATKWVSTGSGSYTLETVTRKSRGTDVTLHLKEGMDEYLEEWKIRKTVKQYSDFVEYPIVMDIRREKQPEEEGGEPKVTVEEEILNTQKALWARPRKEVSDEEYNEFYKHISHDYQEPLKTIHWKVEGTTEFNALIFLPQKAPFDLFTPDSRNRGVHLYVKRVFITDNCEALIPQYLRFLRGIVDSADLPLNISRENLQEERLIRIIQKNVVKKVLDTLEDMKEKERETYESFWNEFGTVLKEGIHLDIANREKLQDLALFESSSTEPGKYVSLAEYVERMPESQTEIYYLTGDTRQAVENSPLLERFKKHNIEVLFMTDPIDEWVVQSMNSYNDKAVKSVEKAELDLGEEAESEEKKQKEEAQNTMGQLLSFLKKELEEEVKDVQVSTRLTDSACCLVADEMAPGVHMEKILQAMQSDVPPTKRILEVNPDHPLLNSMNELVKDNRNEPKLKEYAGLLYDQALLTAGMQIKDPVVFAQRVSNLMATEGKHILGQDA